jgi:hypothetical protein
MNLTDRRRTNMEHRDQQPLKWPEGWTRTLIADRKSQGAWKKPLDFYRQAVIKEMQKIGASAVTISRNPIDKERVDPGVAVWFSLKPAQDYSWQAGLHLDNPAPTLDEIDRAYRELAMKYHPDKGGDLEMFKRIKEYRDKARAWVLGNDAPAMDNCIPCDRFVETRQNLAAIRLALAAFRQLERVGIPAILERVMDRAFKAALPDATKPNTGTIHVTPATIA